ncbi:DUF1298 domain-containing protein [Mycobacterium sp. PS03-16]|uniref:WS/DGAT domain-containing protein n=1 Tax=Mycobacterium sp. PS03-16 TaxID=2559611 RepID=UPI001073FB17|nr:WS/DGAT domain-containing protein [Mycobacterium sp. PS03-16]TFV55558.1 DUF1298 domain-containing protein [Mycobacterium sp. PS03-16]
MAARRLAAFDAQTLWLAVKIPSDQLLLYAFAGTPDPVTAVSGVLARARACGDLRLRVADRGPLTYPVWVDAGVTADQAVVHPPVGDWADCLTAVSALADDPLDPQRATWRLHVISPVRGVPGVPGDATVAVVQMSHALADGQRSAALAGWLFGRPAMVPDIPPVPRWLPAALPVRAVRAARAHRLLMRDEAAGVVVRPAQSRPALRSNARPDGGRSVRTLVRCRRALPGPTVTVGVLAAVAEALAEHLRAQGDDPATLGAEVPMAKIGPRLAHNHFGNVGVDLHPDVPFDRRAARIAAELAERRRRAHHPGMQTANRAFAALPAPLLRRGVVQFDPTLRSPTVTGNTVVSSVDRGPADLTFGGAPVVMTAGYPMLSPMMGLVHGVHGIGDTIAVSVHAAASAVGDIDSYADRLAAALDRDR